MTFKCKLKSSTDIDPAIATVPHLLDLLTTARAQNIALQDEVQDLSTKVRRIVVNKCSVETCCKVTCCVVTCCVVTCFYYVLYSTLVPFCNHVSFVFLLLDVIRIKSFPCPIAIY